MWPSPPARNELDIPVTARTSRTSTTALPPAFEHDALRTLLAQGTQFVIQFRLQSQARIAQRGAFQILGERRQHLDRDAGRHRQQRHRDAKLSVNPAGAQSRAPAAPSDERMER